jgi:hypothetical protein
VAPLDSERPQQQQTVQVIAVMGPQQQVHRTPVLGLGLLCWPRHACYHSDLKQELINVVTKKTQKISKFEHNYFFMENVRG